MDMRVVDLVIAGVALVLCAANLVFVLTQGAQAQFLLLSLFWAGLAVWALADRRKRTGAPH